MKRHAGSRDFKRIVRDAYDEQANLYAGVQNLQLQNLRNLLSLLLAEADLQPGRLLDVGSGTSAGAGQPWNRVLSRGLRYTGCDLSLEMVRASRRVRRGADTCVADAEVLPFGDQTFDVIVSNSVLHWLNVPEERKTPRAAVEEMARALRPGGWFAVSVAADGTAQRFQQAYRRVMRAIRRSEVARSGSYRPDPIGSMTLPEVVELVNAAGLDIHRARADYEPAVFRSPLGYCDTVRAYGFAIYLAGLAKRQRERVWARIVEEFVDDVGDQAYVHDQFMIYVIARRPMAS